MGRKSASTRLEELEAQLKPTDRVITGFWTREELEAFRAAGFTIGGVGLRPGKASPEEWGRLVREHQKNIGRLVEKFTESLMRKKSEISVTEASADVGKCARFPESELTEISLCLPRGGCEDELADILWDS